jgi:hypothetical protein
MTIGNLLSIQSRANGAAKHFFLDETTFAIFFVRFAWMHYFQCIRNVPVSVDLL